MKSCPPPPLQRGSSIDPVRRESISAGSQELPVRRSQEGPDGKPALAVRDTGLRGRE